MSTISSESVLNENYEMSSHETACKIMGRNFFGIEAAAKHFGVNPTTRQFAALAQIPFSEKTLNACKDSHVLVAVFPLSIANIYGTVQKLDLFHQEYNYEEAVFFQNKGEIGWQLVRKRPVNGSASKTWSEQQTLLSNDEEIPTARILIYTIIGHYLATKERLFKENYIRCVDLESHFRICVGVSLDKIHIRDCWDEDKYPTLRLATVMK